LTLRSAVLRLSVPSLLSFSRSESSSNGALMSVSGVPIRTISTYPNTNWELI
jgi:hypothetical protein